MHMIEREIRTLLSAWAKKAKGRGYIINQSLEVLLEHPDGSVDELSVDPDSPGSITQVAAMAMRIDLPKDEIDSA